ncbi:MAG: hypothetical protein IH987_13565 [Planctomycetes bacterium]|nr:hypothetical protein [Planctomycetota bacterium]
MINHTSKCFYGLAIFCMAVTLRPNSLSPLGYQELIGATEGWHIVTSNIALVVLALLIGLRLSLIAKYHHELNCKAYLFYAERFRADILSDLRGSSTEKGVTSESKDG